MRHDEIIGLPLSVFRERGQLIEFSVPWSKKTLFLVGSDEDAERLRSKGYAAGRIWTVDEVLPLVHAGVGQEAMREIGEVKLAVRGTVTHVNKEAVIEHQQEGTPERASIQADPGGRGVPRDAGFAQSRRMGSHRHQRDGHRPGPVQEQQLALLGRDGDAA